MTFMFTICAVGKQTVLDIIALYNGINKNELNPRLLERLLLFVET